MTDPSGVSDLAERLLATTVPKGGPPHPEALGLSEANLRLLIALTFQVSLDTYEGRHLSFGLAVFRQDDVPRAPLDLQLGHRHVDGVATLKSMARSVPRYPSALLIYERSGQLYSGGVVDCRRDGDEGSGKTRPSQARFMLEVLAPGSIVARRSGWRLRAGVVDRPPSLRAHLRGVAAAVVSPINQHADSTTWEKHAEAVTAFISAAVRYPLDRVSGAAFVFIPGGHHEAIEVGVTASLPIDVPHTTDRFAQAVRNASSRGSTTPQGAADLAAVARERELLQSAIRSIGAAAMLDGAVVFDESLSLRGFGATLKAVLREQLLDVVDGRGEKVSELPLSKKGTRHRSAAALVQSAPSATVLVLSQDGGARVFRQVKDKACVSPECAVDASILTAQ